MPLKYFRATVARGVKAGAIDREQKIIHGYAVISRGEALGHDIWIDSEMLAQVVTAGNSTVNGIKSRFTHPGMCSDGLGKHLGRTKNFRIDGDAVRADLHLADVASSAPDGDLAGYVMNLAAEDPEAFGASIVFARDLEAEDAFIVASGGAKPESRWDAPQWRSPDEKNTKNFRHARLASLNYSDVVDEPAANPDGFFSMRGELTERAETGLSYLFGLTAREPAEMIFGEMDAERVKTFFNSFLQRHGLSVSHVAGTKPGASTKESLSMMTPEEKAAANEEFKTAERNRVASLKAAFPKHPDFVVAQVEAGASLSEATIAFKDVELAVAKAANVALEAKLAAVPAASQTPANKGPAPVKFGSKTEESTEGKDFMALAREYASAHKCTLAAAMQPTAEAHPDEHDEYVAASRKAPPRKIERVASK